MLKRAQESVGTPVSIVLVLAAIGVAAILLLVFVAPKLIEIPDREICRYSVIARSQTKMGGTESNWPLACHTRFIEIKKDGIYKNGEIDERFKRGEKRSEKKNKTKRYVANQMYDCWYQFNKGKSDPWGEWHLGTKHRCVICADISFDSEFNDDMYGDGMTGRIEGFGEFLNNEPISRSSKETYSEYLGGKIEEVYGADDLYIDTSQAHLVLYTLSDVGALGGIIPVSFAGCISGGIIAAKIGAVLNAIPGFGQIGWGAGVGVGCVVGFAGGVYRYIFGANKVELKADVILIPAAAVDRTACTTIG